MLLYVIVGLVVAGLVILKIYIESIKGKCNSQADLTGKTALVTGANTGIGYWTALDLARRHAKVILACRDLGKGQEAVRGIVAATGNSNVVVKKLDLSRMKSVREFVEDFLSEESHLHILVNNAGVAGIQLDMTEEGFETMNATNHFGPFLLTNLLLDLLQKSQPSRIVNVSSMAHTWSSSLDVDNLRAEKSYDIRNFYQIGKLANILFTRELARRLEGTGIAAHTLHPGPVPTKILRKFFPKIFLPVYPIVAHYYLKSAEEGAQTSIYCAVSEELEGVSGKYYVDCKEAEEQASDLSRDMGLAKKLWEASCMPP